VNEIGVSATVVDANTNVARFVIKAISKALDARESMKTAILAANARHRPSQCGASGEQYLRLLKDFGFTARFHNCALHLFYMEPFRRRLLESNEEQPNHDVRYPIH